MHMDALAQVLDKWFKTKYPTESCEEAKGPCSAVAVSCETTQTIISLQPLFTTTPTIRLTAGTNCKLTVDNLPGGESTT